MSNQEHVDKQLLSCSDGECRNIKNAKMLYVLQLVGMIPGGTVALKMYLDSIGYDVNVNPRCQPGKAFCVKKRE